MRETERGGSIAAMTMNAERILEQISSLKDSSESFASEKDADPIWQMVKESHKRLFPLQDVGKRHRPAMCDVRDGGDRKISRKELTQWVRDNSHGAPGY